MKLSLPYRTYLFLKGFIWILYCIYLVHSFQTIVDHEILFAVVLVAPIMQLTLLTFLSHWRNYNKPLLLDWFCLTTFLTLVLNFVFLSLNLKGVSAISVNDQTDVKLDYLLPGNLIILLGLLGLRSGEFLLRGGKKIINNFNLTREQFYLKRHTGFYMLTLVIGITQLGLIVYGVMGYGTFQEHTTASYSFLLNIVSVSAPFLLTVLATLKYFKGWKGLKFNTFLWGFILVQLTYGFLSGMKENSIIPFVILLIPFVLSGRQISKHMVAAGILFLLILYPFNNNYRQLLNSGMPLTRPEAIQLAVVNTLNNKLSESLIEGGESYASRISLFPMLLFSIQNEPNWHYYKEMDRYVYLPLAWILPRVLLPGKPKSETGSQLSYMLDGNDKNSITPSTFGWTYLEGGYIFVFLAFLILGILVVFIETKVGRYGFFGYLMYVAILVNFLKVESDVYFLISDILQTGLVYFFLTKYFIGSGDLKFVRNEQ